MKLNTLNSNFPPRTLDVKNTPVELFCYVFFRISTLNKLRLNQPFSEFSADKNEGCSFGATSNGPPIRRLKHPRKSDLSNPPRNHPQPTWDLYLQSLASGKQLCDIVSPAAAPYQSGKS